MGSGDPPAAVNRDMPAGTGLHAVPVSSLVFAGLIGLLVVLFVVADAARTLGEARAQLGLLARSFAAEIEPLPTQAAGRHLIAMARAYDPMLTAVLRDRNGSVLSAVDPSPASGSVYATDFPATQLIGARAPAGALGDVLLRLPAETALWPMLLRAALAALAGLGVVATALRWHGGGNHRRGERAAGFGALMAALPFGLAHWDETGRMLACNRHYSLRLAAGGRQRPKRHYHDAIRQLAQGGYLRLVADADDGRLMELHRADGSCLVIDERPLADGGFITLVTDATERRRADKLLASIEEERRQLARRYHEEKLRAEAASRSKTYFLANLSHDVRTPLNHIIGFAELMAHETYGPLGDRRYRGYVETIKSSGERLLASFATILDYAELESGRRALKREPLTADALLAAVRQRFAAQAERARVRLTLGAPCHARLLGDRLGLERMLGNLVDNALRYTTAEGQVTLAAYAGEDGVVLEVADTGIGMSQERLQSLSQPFVSGDAAFTRDHEGAGLGVAIARAIAELSGGRLAIDSSPGLGTTVAISLPLTPADAASRAA